MELNRKESMLVVSLADRLHDLWRSERRLENGTFVERVKETNDKDWIGKHGTSQVDIANTSFSELPSDWQKENLIAATDALAILREAIKNDIPLDSSFVEEASADLHSKWLARNSSWASDVQCRPYKDLPEEEKEKDRIIIREAIRIYSS
jgi:hypothetical protein